MFNFSRQLLKKLAPSVRTALGSSTQVSGQSAAVISATHAPVSLRGQSTSSPALRRVTPRTVIVRHEQEAQEAAFQPMPTLQPIPLRSVVQAPTMQPLAVETPITAAPAPAETKVNPLAAKSDAELAAMTEQGKLRFFNLENELGKDFERAVRVRRLVVENKTGSALEQLPYQNQPYAAVFGQCAENVIGMVPIPVGVAGPLNVDGKEYFLPMATTEGALIASTTRGCKAISMSGGARTVLLADGMTRAPVLSVPDVKTGYEIKRFLETNREEVFAAFNSTSRFARLQDIHAYVAGRKLFLRFKSTSGDAMGMNMVGKGVDHALKVITTKFPQVSVLALSGNVCTDKKPSAMNWIEGRGKSVAVDAIIKGDIVKDVLKTTVDAMVEVNYGKVFVGGAIAGSIGGFNAHASNVVTAMFLATGQDPAQNVESSNCMTLMEPANEGKDLYVSVSMPSLEVGTVGGGTSLPGQSAMLSMLGVKGSHSEKPGQNAATLARIIASTVMAGELSLTAALSSGHLISSHMKLNRKPTGAAGATNSASH